MDLLSELWARLGAGEQAAVVGLLITCALAAWGLSGLATAGPGLSHRIAPPIRPRGMDDDPGATSATMRQLAAQLGRLSQRTGESDAEEIGELLLHAGYWSTRAPEIFEGLRITGLLAGLTLGAPSLVWFTLANAGLFTLLCSGLGYYLPLWILRVMARSRREDLLESFPDAVDLLVNSVEAGLGLDASFRRVAEQIETVSTEMGRELRRVHAEVTAGLDRNVALQNLADRTGLAEIRTWVQMMIQSERYGSSIAATLRTYAHVTREKRLARAEELAGQAGTKLTITMITFFLPVLIVVLMAPVALEIAMDMGRGTP